MAGSTQLPKDLLKLFEVRDTSAPMRKFIIELLTRIEALEQRIKVLESGS